VQEVESALSSQFRLALRQIIVLALGWGKRGSEEITDFLDWLFVRGVWKLKKELKQHFDKVMAISTTCNRL
jgi:hypothetical protein